MKRLLAALSAGIIMIAGLSACDGSNSVEEEVTPYPVTVENVTIHKQPRAVASLSPSLTKILLDLGYQEQIVGYSDEDEIPEGVVLSDLSEAIAEAQAAAQEEASSAGTDASSDGAEGDPSSAGGSQPQGSSSDAAAPDTGDTGAVPSGETASGVSSDPLMTSSLAEFLETWDGKSPIPREPVLYGTVGTAMDPDLTKIGILKPEILFTTLPLTRAQMDKLDSVNIKVIVLPAASTVEELTGQYLNIIKAMEGQLAADSTGRAIVSDFQARLDYIASQVPQTKKSFLYVCSLDPLIATGDTWESGLLSLVGTNLAQEKAGYTVTAEELAAMNPDVIFYSAPLEAEHFTESALFQTMAAVTEGRLVEVDAAALLNQTRDVVETLREIASTLYPEVDFTQPEPSSEPASGETGSDPAAASSLPEPAGEVSSSEPAGSGGAAGGA